MTTKSKRRKSCCHSSHRPKAKRKSKAWKKKTSTRKVVAPKNTINKVKDVLKDVERTGRALFALGKVLKKLKK